MFFSNSGAGIQLSVTGRASTIFHVQQSIELGYSRAAQAVTMCIRACVFTGALRASVLSTQSETA